MTDIITVVAYKSNSVDTCRGCVMGREDSELDMFVSDKPEAVADFVAKLKTANLDNLGSYEFTFFVNGRHVWDEGCSVNEDLSDADDYYTPTEYEEVIQGIRQTADARTVALVKERAEAKALKERQAAEARERQRKQTDIARLKELRAQYPDA